MNAQEIRDLFKRHDVPLSRDDVWEVRPGAPVIRHHALERLALAIGVRWGEGGFLRKERDEAVISMAGWLEGRQRETFQWTTGEACIGQNYIVRGKMAAYPYAMAEKRCKDRIIIKLAGLHGAYSEEEADDFKQGDKPEKEQQAVPPTRDSRSVYVENSLNLIEQIQTPEAVSAWLDTEVEKGVWRQYGITEHQDDGKAILMACKKRRLELRDAA